MSSKSHDKSFIVKYSPSCLREFGDRHQQDTHMERAIFVLQTLIDMDDMNVLLIGGTNSGKTTLLFSLLRAYYRLAPHTALSETNVLFINNLKEQGIQFFRTDMKTFCQTHCTVNGRKKVIVVDDLDSINKQSQQVFRNYLDKYKGHVCMIAACSNSQKVIESLQSRLHIIAVQPPTTDKIAWTLDTIAEKEDIRLGEGARAYLLSRSHNSVRNVINNLEKLDIYRPVVDNSSTSAVLDKEVCEKLCSTISFRPFEQYLDALKRGHLQEAIQVIYGIYNYGYSVIDILEYFFEFVKITPMLTDAEKYEIAPHICNYITIFHDMHEHSIELALFTRKVFQVTAVDVPL